MAPDHLAQDIRATALFREVENIYRAVRAPGTGWISEVGDLAVSPDGRIAIFTGSLSESLERASRTCLCSIDLVSSEVRLLTDGPGSDRMPQFSPRGDKVAFLSDRAEAGNFQVWFLDPESEEVAPAPTVPGWVEYFAWSPAGGLLLGVAAHGTDQAARHGGITTRRAVHEQTSWMPAVEGGGDVALWRTIWLHDPETGDLRALELTGVNVWEAVWCGDAAIAAVVSAQASEGAWYGAHLEYITIDGAERRRLLTPPDQIGGLAADPSGRQLACVEAFCSDRGVIAGRLRLIDLASGASVLPDTDGMDVSHAEWRSPQNLLLAGHRGLETVVAGYDAGSGQLTRRWASREISAGGAGAPFARVAGWGDAGNFAFIVEGFFQAPSIATVQGGQLREVRSFEPVAPGLTRDLGHAEPLNWMAGDGISIEGWLLRPPGEGPFPTVMTIHGGPVFHHRPKWLASASVAALLLLRRGCAIFMPNPRGSSGRGDAFARAVAGDMGGADAADCLAGLDDLVERGIADPVRLGVVGGSYGGFMTAWLITQVDRFAAAVAVAPMTNMISWRLTSNIPHFSRLFLKDDLARPDGQYVTRSPVMMARSVTTPCLTICGALDRCTPASEAAQFHNALREQGAASVLVTYPQEGHGVRTLPAAIDYAARVAGWFGAYLGLKVVSGTVSGRGNA